MSDELKKQKEDEYKKVKARVKFEAVGVEGTTQNELKILYFNGLINREKFETLRAERRKFEAAKNEQIIRVSEKQAEVIEEENSSADGDDNKNIEADEADARR